MNENEKKEELKDFLDGVCENLKFPNWMKELEKEKIFIDQNLYIFWKIELIPSKKGFSFFLKFGKNQSIKNPIAISLGIRKKDEREKEKFSPALMVISKKDLEGLTAQKIREWIPFCGLS